MDTQAENGETNISGGVHALTQDGPSRSIEAIQSAHNVVRHNENTRVLVAFRTSPSSVTK